MSSMWTFSVMEFGRKFNFSFFPNNLIFGLSEVVKGPFLKFPIVRQILNFEIFGLTPPYSGHIWVARTIFSDENSIYGSYGPHIYGGITYMGHTGPILPEKVLIYEPSANPILEKVLIWSLLGLILVSIGPHLASIGSYLDPIELYLVPIEPYLSPIELYLVPIEPYLALFGLIWP